jgi:hypothetical protein
VNGRRLKRGEKYPIAAGDRLTLGLEISALFYMPAELYGRVTRA